MSAPAELYVEYLTQEGYLPEIDADGDVVFTYDGGTYYIDIDRSDEEYFCLVFPNFWSIDSVDELSRVLFAANFATMMTKVAKVHLRSDGRNTMATIEMFFGRPEAFKEVFRRSISALKAGVRNFHMAIVLTSSVSDLGNLFGREG